MMSTRIEEREALTNMSILISKVVELGEHA
jgi:hypothetical protein